MDDPAGGKFHWDKRIPVAVLIGLGVQTLAIVFWLGTQSSRVTALEEAVARILDAPSKIAVVESKIETMQKSLDKIDVKIDQVIVGRSVRPP